MTHPSHQVRVELPKAGMLRLHDMSGVELHCLSGTLWLTLDSDPKDVVLKAGESFVTTARRPAIVYALAPASARLLRPAGAFPAAGAPRRTAPWLQWLRSRLRGGSRGTTPAPT